MKLPLPIIAAIWGAILGASAQEIQPKQPDPVLEHLTRLDGEIPKTSEVSVVLDDVGVPPAVLEDPSKKANVPPPEPAAPEPLLVTGTPPAHAELVKEPLPESSDPEKGVAVQVVKLQSGKGPIDPEKVKLLAPFPAKPLSDIPAGWVLDASGKAPPFTREIEFSPGSKITLNIRPHVLIPAADGVTQFSLDEPGFDPGLGFHQASAVGTILATSIGQLDEDSKQLGTAIDRLQQLLVSLPTPPPEAPIAAPIPGPTVPKKR